MAVLLLCTVTEKSGPSETPLHSLIAGFIAKTPAPAQWQLSRLTDENHREMVMVRGKSFAGAQLLSRTILSSHPDIEMTVWELADLTTAFNILCP